jgi:hypothetical protein
MSAQQLQSVAGGVSLEPSPVENILTSTFEQVAGDYQFKRCG